MFRKLTILIALVALLAACSTQDGGGTTAPSTDAGASAAASASAGAPDGSAVGTGTATAACSEAFAAVADQDVSSLSDMADLEEVEATIQDCESIADWSAGAAEVIGEVNPATAQLLLEIRCEVPGLGDTAVCEEVAAS